MSHTPGPWTVKLSGHYYSVVYEGDFDSVPHTKENVTLMAAAPEMRKNIEEDLDLLQAIETLAVDSKDWEHIVVQVDAMIKRKKALLDRVDGKAETA